MMKASADTLATLVLTITVIVMLAAICGGVARRLGQPPVIGEILAGIALGPSLLGHVPGVGATVSSTLFTAGVRSQLTALSTLGLLVFMFMVGLELDLRNVRRQGGTALFISASSIAIPMALGTGLAICLYGRYGRGVPIAAFILFIGVAMSITAFPVLARILVERHLDRTSLGSLVLACAAVDDVIAWSLLAVATALVGAGGGLLLTGAGAVLFLLVTALVTRRCTAWIVVRYRRAGEITPGIFVAVVSGMLLSAYATERIGIHAIFGAFAFGASFPRGESEFLRQMQTRLIDISMLILMPVFFVVTGLSVDIAGLTPTGLVLIPVVIALACAGKFGGAVVAARWAGLGGREAASVGVLMNTRGLTELVALNVGFSIGVLNRELLAVFVIMAVVTTVITNPLLTRILPPGTYDSLAENLPPSMTPTSEPTEIDAEIQRVPATVTKGRVDES